jgi:hypothetical protein
MGKKPDVDSEKPPKYFLWGHFEVKPRRASQATKSMYRTQQNDKDVLTS